MIANRLPGALILGSALVFAACGGEGLTLPPEGEPAHIEVIEGNGQSGRVDSTLADSIVVEVTDLRGRPVAGATVNFTFPEASGAAASPATATTNSDGLASSSVRLGPHVGEVTGQAEVPVDQGVTPVQATFIATAFSAAANGISLVDGDDQSAPVGAALPRPLVVQVSDQFGNPIPGITITWSVTGGGGVSEETTVTGPNGQAAVTRTLGPTAGQWTALATAGGLAGSPVTFTHTATAGSASRVEIVSGDDQRGAPGAELDAPLIVRVLDAANNPIVDIAVEWVVAQGGGSATPQSSRTDAQGQASTRWTLGPTSGDNTLNAVVSGVGRAEFSAVGDKTESNVSITSDNPDPSLVGQAVQVAVTVSGDGGTPTGSVTVTGEGAGGPCTITLSNGSGSCEIVFTQPGNQQLTATYNGDARFAADSDTESHRVEPVVPANNPPTATNDAATTNEDESVTIDVQANDDDPDGDALTTTVESQPQNGTATVNANGSVTYTPSPNFNGTNSFTYRVTDPSGASSSATVQVTVNPVNDPPDAGDDAYTTPGTGQPLSVPAPGVLGNDSDPDGPSLSARNASVPTQGTVTLQPDGSFIYTPAIGASGADSFTYEAYDGSLASQATVNITIAP